MDREAILELLRESLSITVESGLSYDFSGRPAITVELRLGDEVISRDYTHIDRDS